MHNTHRPIPRQSVLIYSRSVRFYMSVHICINVIVPVAVQSHHLCAQVHLCLAGRESGAGRAAQQNSLLGYTGGGGTNALSPADQLSCRWGGGQVDLRGEDQQNDKIIHFLCINTPASFKQLVIYVRIC